MSRIVVELQAVPEGASEYQKVAELVVAEDGTHTLDDPQNLFPLEVPVPVFDAGRPLQVHFADEPHTWARHLPNLLRTGYLVPKVVEL